MERWLLFRQSSRTPIAVLALQMNYQEEAMKQLERLDDLTGQYDVLFCDVWGVVHNGVSAYPAAIEAPKMRAGQRCYGHSRDEFSKTSSRCGEADARSWRSRRYL